MDLKERAADLARRRKACQAAISRELKPIGLELRTCGTKNPLLRENSISQETGGWASESVKTKPPRWLIRFAGHGGSIKAMPVEENDGICRIGYFNLRTDTVAAVGIRMLPVVPHEEGNIEALEAFEWFMVAIFSEPLRAGTSGDAFDFNMKSGDLLRQEEILPLEHICIIGLADPDEPVSGTDNQFGQYTEALERMLLSATEITEEDLGE